MTPKLCSVHNHATLCDGRDTPEAMAAAAFAQGIRYFGLSCHSHTPIPDDEGAVLPADMTAYRDTVLRRGKPLAKPPILCYTILCLPEWRNGRRDGLKIRWQRCRVGSSPTSGTT